MRIAKTAIILSLLCILFLFAVRFLLLDQFIAYGLQKAGAADISVHVSDVGLKQIRFDVLDATFHLSGNDLLSVKLRNISLHYNLQSLVVTGKCSRIAIEEMQLERIHEAPYSSTGMQIPDQVILVQDELRSRLPFEHLVIEKLQLHGDLPPQLADRPIFVNIDRKDKALMTKIVVQEDPDTRLTVDFKSPDASHATATLVGQQASGKICFASFELTPEKLSGGISLLLKPMRELLLQTVDIPELPEVNGSMDGTFRLPLPLQNDSEIVTEIVAKDTAGYTITVNAAGNPTTQQANIALVGKLNEEEFLRSRIVLVEQRIKGTYSFQGAPLIAFLKPFLKTKFPEIKGTFAGSLDIPLNTDDGGKFSLSGKADSLAFSSFQSKSAEVYLIGSIADNILNLDRKSRIHAEQIIFGENLIQTLSLDLAGTMKKKDEQLQLDFSEQQAFHVKGLAVGKLRVKDFRLHPEEPLRLSIHNNSFTVHPNTFFTTSPVQISVAEKSCDMERITCSVSRLEKAISGLELLADLKIAAVILKTKDIQLPLKDISGMFQLKDKVIIGKVQFFPETIFGRMQASFEHDMGSGDGSYTLKTDRRFDLSEEGTTLANLLTSWKFPFNLESGKISFKAGGAWGQKQKLKMSVFVTVTAGSGFYKQFLFNGLDVRQDLAVLPRLHSKTEGSFFLQQLIGGIDVHDIHTKVNFVPVNSGKLPLVELSGFNASLFEGGVSSTGIRYDLNEPDSNFVVHVQDVNLESLVDLVKMDSLYVTGRMSGDIPVSIKGKDISVDYGELYSESPGGEVRYSSANVEQSGLTGYALKAVENLQYNSLKVAAKYLPSGQLDLDIKLKGTSPGLQTSRPVHLNIHAEQNLPALLQSLRFSKGLTEELDKRIKQHYN